MCHLLKERKKPGSVGKMHETDMHVGKYEITSGLIIGAQTGSQFKLTLTTSSVTSDNFLDFLKVLLNFFSGARLVAPCSL